MKRSLPLFFLLLLSVQPSFAIRHFLGQYYEGEAKPRTEVTRIWLQVDVDIRRIDDHVLRAKDPKQRFGLLGTGMDHLRTIEVLPGKHIVMVGYDNGSVHSTQSQEIHIDAKGGEDYSLSVNRKAAWKDKNEKWDAAIASFTPSEHDAENFDPVVLEGTEIIDGVVQSVEAGKHGYIKSFALSVRGESSPRIYKREAPGLDGTQLFQPLKEGLKIRVEYFPSGPGEAYIVWGLN
jgi:hypothetical protein